MATKRGLTQTVEFRLDQQRLVLGQLMYEVRGFGRERFVAGSYAALKRLSEARFYVPDLIAY